MFALPFFAYSKDWKPALNNQLKLEGCSDTTNILSGVIAIMLRIGDEDDARGNIQVIAQLNLIQSFKMIGSIRIGSRWSSTPRIKFWWYTKHKRQGITLLT